MFVKIEGVIVSQDRKVGTVLMGEGDLYVTLDNGSLFRAKVVKPKRIAPDGRGGWIVQEAHVSKGDWLTDGTMILGRAIADHPFAAHVQQPLDPAS